MQAAPGCCQNKTYRSCLQPHSVIKIEPVTVDERFKLRRNVMKIDRACQYDTIGLVEFIQQFLGIIFFFLGAGSELSATTVLPAAKTYFVSAQVIFRGFNSGFSGFFQRPVHQVICIAIHPRTAKESHNFQFFIFQVTTCEPEQLTKTPGKCGQFYIIFGTQVGLFDIDSDEYCIQKCQDEYPMR